MALTDFQTAMGRLVRAAGGRDPLRRLSLNADERSCLSKLTESAGFRATVSIQRSWCEGRAAQTARTTLSLLNEDRRKQLLTEWAASGAGTSSFVEKEADAFLEFLSARLDDPSEALTVCRIERATLRASEGARRFMVPDLSGLDDPKCAVRWSEFATLVPYEGGPEFLLFAPGIPGLWRPATAEDVMLWQRLRNSALVRELWPHYAFATLAACLNVGTIEFAFTNRSPQIS